MIPGVERPPRLRIEKIVYPGRSLGRRESRVYFTDEGLPGETVEIEILKEHASFIEARTTAVPVPSPLRIPARCGHYRTCGVYQTLPYDAQLDLKKNQLREICRTAELSVPDEIDIVPSPAIWRYRNKVRFSLARRKREFFLAYNEPGSRTEFVEAGGCFLAGDRACATADEVLDVVRVNSISNLAEIEIREGRPDGDSLLNLFWKAPRKVRDIDPVLSSVGTRSGAAGIVSWTAGRGRRITETPEWGRSSIRTRIGDLEYEIGAGSFFQVNESILPRVLADMAEAASFQGTETIADIYGGVGTFGLALAGRVKRVHIVESAPEAVPYLNANIARNRMSNVTVCEGTAEEWMAELAGRGLDLAIVDPPRKGLDPAVIQALIAHRVDKVIYLSCNPTTLVRDLALLGRIYTIKSFRAYDFFPQTPHIETLAVLNRR